MPPSKLPPAIMCYNDDNDYQTLTTIFMTQTTHRYSIGLAITLIISSMITLAIGLIFNIFFDPSGSSLFSRIISSLIFPISIVIYFLIFPSQQPANRIKHIVEGGDDFLRRSVFWIISVSALIFISNLFLFGLMFGGNENIMTGVITTAIVAHAQWLLFLRYVRPLSVGLEILNKKTFPIFAIIWLSPFLLQRLSQLIEKFIGYVLPPSQDMQYIYLIIIAIFTFTVTSALVGIIYGYLLDHNLAKNPSLIARKS